MRERKSKKKLPEPKHVAVPKHVPVPWSLPVTVDDVPEETARHFKLTADADTRAAVAKVAELRDLPRLEATFEVTRRGSNAACRRQGFGDGRPELRGDARAAQQ